jgi:hypothetical protein
MLPWIVSLLQDLDANAGLTALKIKQEPFTDANEQIHGEY